MATGKSNKCYCGCGQASSRSCRLRLVECECGCKVRMTRDWITRVSLTCSCGGKLEPVCLDDRAMTGDEQAWGELQARVQRSEQASDAGKASAAMRRARKAVGSIDPRELARVTNGASLIGASQSERFATGMPF